MQNIGGIFDYCRCLIFTLHSSTFYSFSLALFRDILFVHYLYGMMKKTVYYKATVRILQIKNWKCYILFNDSHEYAWYVDLFLFYIFIFWLSNYQLLKTNFISNIGQCMTETG